MFYPARNSIMADIINAPRTMAYRAYKEECALGLFFEECEPASLAKKVEYYLNSRDFFIQKSHEVERDYIATHYVASFGWTPKEAFKIASGYWNNSNHPGIEYNELDFYEEEWA